MYVHHTWKMPLHYLVMQNFSTWSKLYLLEKIFNYDDSQDVSNLVRWLDGHLNVSTRQHLDHPSGGRCFGCSSQHPRLACEHKHGTSMDEACSWTATSWILTTTELAGPSMSIIVLPSATQFTSVPEHHYITTTNPRHRIQSCTCTYHKDHVVVAIAVQNLVIINVVIL